MVEDIISIYKFYKNVFIFLVFEFLDEKFRCEEGIRVEKWSYSY